MVINLKLKNFCREGSGLSMFALRSMMLAVMCVMGQAHAESNETDLTNLPFEQLLQTEVVTASRLAKQVSDSPAAVSIVTADDIRTFSYRSLAEVLNSMRGLYTTYDRRYEYLGGRGFGSPGDYAGRIMLLIDGYAAQDNLFGQLYLDNSGMLDMETIDRVEYVPGTGGATYGNGAFLGIVNVITKNGNDFNSLQVSGEAGSFQTYKRRATFGKQFENGANLLLSASRLTSPGQNLYFPYFDQPNNNNGITVGHDGEGAKRLFCKFQFEGLSVESGYSDRTKGIPFPLRESGFNKLYKGDDNSQFLSIKYDFDLVDQIKGGSHLYRGVYNFSELREFGSVSPSDQYIRKQNRGTWLGFDQKFVMTTFKNHTLVFGSEYRDNKQQDFYSVDQNSMFIDVPIYGEEKYSYQNKTLSFYATDEVILTNQFNANVGLRYDRPESFDCTSGTCSNLDYKPHYSPRFAFIYTPQTQTTFKLSYSQAFRLPTAYELPKSNSSILKPERVAATELAVIHDLSDRTRLTGSVYSYHLKDLHYNQSTNGTDIYDGSSSSYGFELQLDRTWEDGTKIRTSGAFQNARDPEGNALVNSPRQLYKINLSAPLIHTAWRGGFEVQYLGRRIANPITNPDSNDNFVIVANPGRQLGGTTLFNLTLSSPKNKNGFSGIFSIKNVTNRKLEVVSPKEFNASDDSGNYIPGGAVIDTITMDGRTFWLQLNYDFGL